MFGIKIVKESELNSLKSELDLIKSNFEQKALQDRMTLDDNLLQRGLFKWIMNGSAIHYDAKDETYISKGYIYNPHVYTVVSYICQCLSQINFYDNRIIDKKSHSEYLRLKSIGQHEEANVYKQKSLERIESKGAGSISLAELLKNPNPNQDWSEFMFETTGYFELTGNSYTYGVEPIGRNGLFAQLFSMPATLTEIVLGDWKNPIQGYKLKNTYDKYDEIPKEAVLHQKNWNPDHTINNINPYGLSTLKALCRTLRRSNESVDANLAMLLNGGPPGIVSNDSERPLKPEEVDAAEKQWQAKRGGGENKNRVMFSATNLKYQQVGLDSVDLAILESDKADFSTMCRAWKIDEIVLNPESSSYNNKLQAEKSVWQNTLIPKLVAQQRGLNKWLVPGWNKYDGFEHFIDFDTSNIACLQTDLDKLTERLNKEFGMGMWSPNDLLIAQGKQPDLSNPFMNQRFMENRYHELGKEPNNPDINPKK